VIVKTWVKVASDVQRMYARCKPAQEASIEYVDSCQHQFDINGTPYQMSISEDDQKPVPPQNIANAKDYVDEALSIAMHAMRVGIHSTMGSSPGIFVFNRDMFLNILLIADWHEHTVILFCWQFVLLLFVLQSLAFFASQTIWSYDSRQLAVAGRSLDMVKPNPIHGRLLVLV